MAIYFGHPIDGFGHLAGGIHRFGDEFHAITRMFDAVFHRLAGGPRSGLQFAHQLTDFLGGFLGTGGQRPDFIGYHGETATLFAGTGGLNGRIQGQQVGLFSDTVNRGNNAINAFAFPLESCDSLSSDLYTVGLFGDCQSGLFNRLVRRTALLAGFGHGV